MKNKKRYNLIVAGGGPSGVAVAISAARQGLQVLLIEKNTYLGGAMTGGLVMPMMRSIQNENSSILDELLSRLAQTGDSINYQNNNRGWFNPERVKMLLDMMVQEAGIDVLFDSVVLSVDYLKNKIEGIECFNKSGRIYYEADFFVDATGDADLASLAGVGFDSGNYGKNQPVSLRFNMGGVDLEKFANWLENFDQDRNVTTVFRDNNQIHLSTACTFDNANWALRPLFEKAIEEGVLEYKDANYFQIFTVAGQNGAIGFNCPRVPFDVNPLDANDTTKALMWARGAIFRLADFCKKYLVGFEKAYVSNIANNLGIRDSRRIKGKYILKEEDICRIMPNPVAKSDYPFDVHSTQKDKSILSRRAYYEIPLESLLVNEFDNLAVCGRCISCDFLMQSSLRIQPTCFAMGESLGLHIAKVLSDKLSGKFNLF